MQGWWKLLIPLGLGALAATLNYMGRSSDIEPVYYVSLKKDLIAGEEIKPAHLESVALPRNLTSSLAKVGIRHQDRPVVFGRRVQRSMKKGDMLLWSDITAPAREWGPDEVLLHLSLDNVALAEDIRVGQRIGFILPRDFEDPAPPLDPKLKLKSLDPRERLHYKLVGPFRVHSLGRRLTDEGGPRPTGLGQEITLVVPAPQEGGTFDENTHRLLTTMFSRGSRATRGSIIVYPAEATALPVLEGKAEKVGEK